MYLKIQITLPVESAPDRRTKNLQPYHPKLLT